MGLMAHIMEALECCKKLRPRPASIVDAVSVQGWLSLPVFETEILSDSEFNLETSSTILLPLR